MATLDLYERATLVWQSGRTLQVALYNGSMETLVLQNVACGNSPSVVLRKYKNMDVFVLIKTSREGQQKKLLSWPLSK
jgi:hypothetical protein